MCLNGYLLGDFVFCIAFVIVFGLPEALHIVRSRDEAGK